MKIKRFVAPDMRSAMNLVRKEHGPDAVILSNRRIEEGVEIVAAANYDEGAVQRALEAARKDVAPPSPPPAPRPRSAADAMIAAVTRRKTAAPAAEPVAATTSAVAALARAAVGATGRTLDTANENVPPPGSSGFAATLARATPQALVEALPEQIFAPFNVEQAAAAERPSVAPDAARLAATAPLAAPVAPTPAVPAPTNRARFIIDPPMDDEPVMDMRAPLARAVPPPMPTQQMQRLPVDAPIAPLWETVPVVPVSAAVPTFNPIEDSPVFTPVVDIAPVAPMPVAPAPIVAAPMAPLAPAAPMAWMAPATHEPVARPLAPMRAANEPAELPVALAAAVEEMEAPAIAATPAASPAPAPALSLVARDDEELRQLRHEVAGMRQVIEREMTRFTDERLRGSPVRAAALDLMDEYGFDAGISRDVALQIPLDTEAHRGRGLMLGLLSRKLPIAPIDPLEAGGVIALVGPTGAGKTTTIAKLASRFAEAHAPRDVALVTTDTGRIGAREQLYGFGRQLGIAVHEANSGSDLTQLLERLQDYKLVLIDTAGLGPRDRALAAQLQWLRAASQIRTLLVLPANTSFGDMDEVVRRFSAANPQGVVLSKLDETGRFGTALSVAVDHRLPITWVTDGQDVPEDLHRATAANLVLRLEDLRRAADMPCNPELNHAVA
ncbi:flagellar biosynthesis protein FlhF [Stenotrophomonas sp.]|uniref:flagellar biosynthesis protein FlhF n=1 Tax=Stenotrophomonas sp. TaxID=69392 RepID=UPI00289B45D5|nr:flagellar biosynthesis protein FlhF [Stenotrophomonas sp.]